MSEPFRFRIVAFSTGRFVTVAAFRVEPITMVGVLKSEVFRVLICTKFLRLLILDMTERAPVRGWRVAYGNVTTFPNRVVVCVAVVYKEDVSAPAKQVTLEVTFTNPFATILEFTKMRWFVEKEPWTII
jgi:hypothetical protein